MSMGPANKIFLINIQLYISHNHCVSPKLSKGAKIRNRYNQVPHLTQDTKVKVTNKEDRQCRYITRNIFKKKICDEMTEDILDVSYVRIFKEIEKKKKMENIYTLLCLRSAELSKAFGLRNLCYSKISVVMLLGYRIAGISRNVESE